SRLFHCSVIKVLCLAVVQQLLYLIRFPNACQQLFYFSLLSSQATAILDYHSTPALSTTFFSHLEVFQDLTVASHAVCYPYFSSVCTAASATACL
ncbi:hypothetical protein, partial [uncultured Eubacterium sp.]|uniref:hypothetical protein n=1 Tax=uncultured Eubacterium sp. TaxID=165185 RepID=UPI0026003EF9